MRRHGASEETHVFRSRASPHVRLQWERARSARSDPRSPSWRMRWGCRGDRRAKRRRRPGARRTRIRDDRAGGCARGVAVTRARSDENGQALLMVIVIALVIAVAGAFM